MSRCSWWLFVSFGRTPGWKKSDAMIVNESWLLVEGRSQRWAIGCDRGTGSNSQARSHVARLSTVHCDRDRTPSTTHQYMSRAPVALLQPLVKLY